MAEMCSGAGVGRQKGHLQLRLHDSVAVTDGTSYLHIHRMVFS